MAGRIPQQFIDELISRVDIVDVIDARVPLKKKGREYVACCPFHNEKTPSFTVSQNKQFYHCFGCGAHGTALGFLMEYDHLDFVEAVERLAADAGLEVPREAGGERRGPSPQPLYDLMTQCARHFQQQLRHHPQRQRAVDYLKRRGLSGEIAAAFGIGYAPEGWDNLLQVLGRGKETQDQLLTAGMLIEKDGGRRYDRFRDRIMFPIRDYRGRVIAFGGRILDKGEPKYLNSPETPIFHKGRELYGLYEARQALREIPRLLVVEGYMDVVALAQFGIRYAVATLGTAVTKEHLERLFRTTAEVVFCFDGDRAGRDAAWRGLENALPLMREGHQLHFAFLPEGEDPDTLVRGTGKDGFEQRITQAQSLSEYFFEQLAKQTDLERLDGRARLVELCRPYLSKLPHGVYRHLMVDRLAKLAHMERGALERMLEEKGTATAAAPALRPAPAQGKQQPSLIRSAIALLLQQPSLAPLVDNPQPLAALRLPGSALLMEMLDLLRQNPHLTTGAVLEHWRHGEHGKHLFALVQRDMLLSAENDDLEQQFKDAISQLIYQAKKDRANELAALSKQRKLTAAETEEVITLSKSND